MEHKKEQLEKHDSYRAKKELDRVREELQSVVRDIEQKEKATDNKNDAIRKNTEGLKQEEDKLTKAEQDILGQLDVMDEKAYDVFFHEQNFMSAELREKLNEPYRFDYIKEQTRLYREKIRYTLQALETEQRCVKDYDDSLKKLDQARKQKEESEKSLEKYENLFLETREEFIEDVYKWDRNNTLLKLDSRMQSLARHVQQYGRETGYNDISTHAHSAFREAENAFTQNQYRIRNEKAKLEEKKDELNNELEQWKNRKDPEPAREEKVTKNRAVLKENGIAHIPFYMAVDFHADVPEQAKGRLEEALQDMGILDALIVSPQYRDKIRSNGADSADRYLTPNPQFMAHTLSEFLKPVPGNEAGISVEDIDNILKTIMLDPDSDKTYLDETGRYRIGLIEGTTSDMTAPKFIGAEARKQFRLENIKRLEGELSQVQKEIEAMDAKIDGILHELKVLKQELDAFPKGDDLEESWRMVKKEEYHLEGCVKELEEKERIAETTFQSLKKAREQVYETAGKCEIPLKLEAYREAEERMDKYLGMLGDLINSHNGYISILRHIQILQEQQDELLQDLDDILYDLGNYKRRQENLLAQKVNFEQALKELGLEEIEKEIEYCIGRYKELTDKLIPDNAALCRELHIKLENCRNELVRTRQENALKEELNRYHEQTFLQEYGLGYVVKGSEPGNTSFQNCRMVLKELKPYDNEQKTREDYVVKLQDTYNINQQFLLEYNVSIQYLFEEKGVTNENLEVNRILANRRRLELIARLEGRESDFYTLIEYIDQSIEQNERLLQEEDRHLFEDILINTVGKKIRARIYHSERWISEINALMQAMNTSSGLSFSLSWRNKAAENEEEMGTRELVELLKSDAALLG